MSTSKAEMCYGEILTERDWKAYELDELIDLLTSRMNKMYRDEESTEPDDSDTSDEYRERSDYHPDREI